MAATTKLIVYNEALRELAVSPLVNLVTVNTRLTELNGAFDHAVEYVLARMDWNFARRRATLTGVSDSSYPPYTYRYARPSDYLRKVWVKTAASDPHQIDHAEAGANLFGFLSSALIEYISDSSEQYDPANWPPHFTRCISLYLALLTGPKLAGSDERTSGIYSRLERALSEAEAFEVVHLTNTQIPSVRQPVLRRAIEIIGQQLSGSIAVHSQADKLRWSMHSSWDHSLKYLLEMGQWNYATRRALLTGGAQPVPGDTYGDIVEGYASGTPSEDTSSDLPDMDGWEYGHVLPTDFVTKIWLKADATHINECPHQFMKGAVYTNEESVVLEYISNDDDALDPETWSAAFLEAMAARLALSVVPELVIEETGKGRSRVTPTGMRNTLQAYWERALSDARSLDAVQQYPVDLPPGRWATARRGSTSLIRRTR